MRRYILFIGKITSAGLVAILILSIFSCVISFSGIHIQSSTGATDYVWEANQWKATMFEGFAWMHMDDNGYNNTHDEEPVDILLMGSSHMEAVNVAQNENVAALLNEMASNYFTYNIGISGHTIYNCVNNMNAAVKEYAPTKYVILETDDVSLEPETMQMVIDGKYGHIQSHDSGILYLTQKYSPAIKNLYKATNEWKNSKYKTAVCIKETSKDLIIGEVSYYQTLLTFLQKAYLESGERLVIFYHPKTQIDKSGDFLDDGDSAYRELFSKACNEIGIKFIDMTQDFLNAYETEHILAHGFYNSAVGVGHLNKFGHRMVAERLVLELRLTED